MASLWCWSLMCPKPKQVASESVHGAQLALQRLATRCEACDVEAGKPCKCGEGGEDDAGAVARVAAVEVNGGEQRHSKPNSSFSHSVINMVGMLIGLGQLSTPYALENGGWASVFLLIGLGVMCAYTAHIIGKCLDEDSGSRTYQDIGERAFGAKGRVVASTFIYLEIFFALVSYTISLSDNLPLVFAGARLHLPWLHLSTTQLLTVIAVLVALPSLWLRDLSSISLLSFAGIVMSLLIFGCVVCAAAFSGAGVGLGKHIPALRLGRIPAVSGLYMFSYAGHIVFPNIYTAMRDPSGFTRVSVASFAVVTALYVALAFVGASLFGPGVSSQVTLSMPPRLAATRVALWATVLTPVTKYALEFAPFAIQLQHHLPAAMGPRARTLVRGGVGSAALLLILALALSVPYFQHVLSLTGSLVSVAICVVFPCAFYLKIRWGRVSRPAVVLNVAMIAAGVALAVVGTVSSARSLVESIQRGHAA